MTYLKYCSLGFKQQLYLICFILTLHCSWSFVILFSSSSSSSLRRWSDGLDSLKDFHRVANSIHPRIQVDLRYSIEKLEFLDVLTIIEHKTDGQTSILTIKVISSRIYEKFNTIRIRSSDKTKLFWGICIQDTEKWYEEESLQTGIHKKIDW